MKTKIIILSLMLCASFAVKAQFNISIQKNKIPKNTEVKTSSNSETQGNRQMVMDDGVTFFDAEPVVIRDTKTNRDIDDGWFLKSTLRILGTFPKGSAFRIVVKKNGKELSNIRCDGNVYIKEDEFKNNNRRDLFNLDFEDFMTVDVRKCFNKDSAIKEVGKLDVELYFVEGGTNKETLVRKHKIDVHKSPRVRVSNGVPLADVSHYYISRHTDAAVAIAYFAGSRGGNWNEYFEDESYIFTSKGEKNLAVFTNVSADGQKNFPANPIAECSVNGQTVNFADNKVRMGKNLDRREMATHSKKGFSEQVEFTGLTFILPAKYKSNDVRDGKWECAVSEKNIIYRIFRFEIKNGELVPHSEQQNGNINLFHKAVLIEIEIPKGGSPFDFRLIPLPADGLFYGIPWASAEGKAMATKVPKKGNPFHTP